MHIFWFLYFHYLPKNTSAGRAAKVMVPTSIENLLLIYGHPLQVVIKLLILIPLFLAIPRTSVYGKVIRFKAIKPELDTLLENYPRVTVVLDDWYI